MPGDRRDEAIFQAGQIAGQHFSRLYIKEDRDLRGRTPGEVAAILYNGAIRGGIAEAAIEIILPEVEALQTAIDRAVAGDLIVMFYEDFEQALAVVQGFAGNRLSSSPYEEDSLLRPDCVPFQAELDHANKPDYSEAYARL
jgi:cyanophycin synthetase